MAASLKPDQLLTEPLITEGYDIGFLGKPVKHYVINWYEGSGTELTVTMSQQPFPNRQPGLRITDKDWAEAASKVWEQFGDRTPVFVEHDGVWSELTRSPEVEAEADSIRARLSGAEGATRGDLSGIPDDILDAILATDSEGATRHLQSATLGMPAGAATAVTGHLPAATVAEMPRDAKEQAALALARDQATGPAVSTIFGAYVADLRTSLADAGQRLIAVTRVDAERVRSTVAPRHVALPERVSTGQYL